jgi:hypothetical protein
MFIFEKGVLASAVAVAGAVFAGVVGYKIIKKKRPDLLKKAKKSISGITERTGEILDGARQSFRAGYAKA